MGIMQLFGKEKNNKMTPEMEAGYRPAPEWWPDLTQYLVSIDCCMVKVWGGFHEDRNGV